MKIIWKIKIYSAKDLVTLNVKMSKNYTPYIATVHNFYQINSQLAKKLITATRSITRD